MDWRTVNFDWNRARAFLVTAEEGSFSAAARALGMAQPTLGRQVDGLEEELGVTLFDRVGRRLVLTPSGVELLDHVRTMGDAASRVSLTTSGRSEALEGSICISASEVTSAYVLPPIIQGLREAHPGIEIELVATNAASDLRRREADIAIRNFRPDHPDLVAKKVKDVAARLYATRGYLERIGRPKEAEDLSRAEFVGFDHGPLLMNGLNALGLRLTPKNFPVITPNHLVQWALVKQGAVIGVMTETVGEPEPLVEQALPELDPFVTPVWLTAHRELKSSRRVRTVFEFLAEALAQN